MKQTIHNVFIRFFIIPLVLLIGGLTAFDSVAAGRETKRVFVLHSYHKGYTFSDNAMRGIDDAFGKSGIKVETYVTYMDVKRIPPTPSYFFKLKELIKEGYNGINFDVIIACDNDALTFMRKYRDMLFPGVPLVFTGINNFDNMMLDGRRDLTGTVEISDYIGTIKLAQKLNPAIKKIVVVSDNTTTGKALRSELEKVRPLFPQKPGFIDLSFADMTMDELAQNLSKLNSDSIVFLLQHSVDRKGTSHTLQESTLILAKSSAVPIFVVSDSRMGLGVLGGHLVSGYYQGETAAQMAVKILNGTDVRTIPVLLDSPNRYMFDYGVMQRFRIAESDLPQGSILINKPVSVLEKYRSHLFAILVIFFVLCGIIIFMLLEIRQRRKIGKTLRESETNLQAIFDTVGTGILIIDKDSQTIIEANPTAIEMIGLPKERIIGQICHSLICPAQRGKCPVKDLGQSVDHSERKLLCAAGNQKDILKTVHPISIKGRDCYLESFIDISDRLRTEDTLRESEEKYRLLVENINDVIFTLDSDGQVTYISPVIEKFSSYKASDLVGKGFLEFVHPDDLPVLMESYKQTVQGELDPSEYRILDGAKVRHVRSSSQLILKDGVFAGLTGVMTDITSRKQAEEEKRDLQERLNRAEKMEALGTLAGGVAHDLNNVLGIIVGYSEMIMDEVDETSSLKRPVVNIFNSGQKAAAIVDDLLTLARRGVPGSSILNLNNILKDSQQSPELAKLLSHHPAVKIKTDLDSDLLNISGSSVHLNKSLYNLISNACEAMNKGGILTIKTTNHYLDKPMSGYNDIREGDYVVLSISDTGEGISEKDMKRIFEPFYTKKIMGRSGTGLGLAVVWGTVTDHNGYINVHSEEGKGSTFTLYFPVTREEIPTEAMAIDVSAYLGNGQSILIVDDVSIQRELATDMLKKLNYNVDSVKSGEEAIIYLKDHQPDLIVLDMIMDPGMDGLDTYKSILKINPQQKTIIVSGFSESDRVKEAKRLGVGAYVRKPYIKEKLGLAVKKELESK